MKPFLIHIIIINFWLGQFVFAQQLEIVNVPKSKVVVGKNFRFDKTLIDFEPLKSASSKSVILHDKNGYLWLIYGDEHKLIRCDGNFVKEFDNNNWQLIETDKGEIIGHNNKGFVIYDYPSEAFKYYNNPNIGNQVSLGEWVTFDKSGKACFFLLKYDKNGNWPFSCFDFKKKIFIKYYIKNVENGYSQNAVPQSVIGFMPRMVAPNGYVWGIFQTENSLGEFGFFDPKTKKCVSFQLDLKVSDLPDKGQNTFTFLHNMFIDGNYVWMGHSYWQAGLLRFDLKTFRWKQFLFPEPFHNRISKIELGKSNELLIENNGGFAIFDKNTELLTSYIGEIKNDFSLKTNNTSFYKSNNGQIWFGLENSANDNEIQFLNSTNQFFENHNLLPDSSSNLRVLLKNKHKMFYSILQNNVTKVLSFNFQSKKTVELWRLDNGKTNFQEITGAIDDTLNHKIWFFGKTKNVGAIFQLDEKNSKILQIKDEIKGLINQSKSLKSILGIGSNNYCQDKIGNIWFATDSDLYKYEASTRQFRIFEEGKNGLLKANFIYSLLADSEGKIWIGYRSGALICLDTKTNKPAMQTPIKVEGGGDIKKILEDKKRNVIWISRLGDGLWKYDQTKKLYSKIPEITSSINMHLTKLGILWIRTSQNIIRYNPDNKQIMKFGTEFFNLDFNWTPFTKTEDDDFYLGKYTFNSNDIKPGTVKPKAVFSNIKVFDKFLQTSQNLNITNSIDLNNSQNFFTVGFSILTYFQNEKNQYLYQLQGFNKDWVNAGNSPNATFTNVPPGQYTLKIKGANYEGIWSDEQHLVINIIPAYWQTWWFKLLVFISFLGIVYAIYKYNLNQKTLKNRLKTEEAQYKQLEAELQSKIVQTEIKALRAQMNPHFIFNCLNSIEFFTANNQTGKASEYLTKFSKLIRLVLENSRSEKVTLENELETLKLYIEMEAMRFRGKVKYKINVNEALDITDIQIPPLLIQPFVENAIWHGLMHKEEGGEIVIDVNQVNENLLHIEIIDNGIGREKAMEYKSKSATKNKSFGMKVTAERIDLINQLYKTDTKIEIIDLKNEANEAEGTKVIVEIPY